MASVTAVPDTRATIRDTAVAFVVLLGSYALGTYGFPPGYLLLAWFDLFQNALWPGVSGSAYEIGLVGYCAVLAVGSAGVGWVARHRRAVAAPRWWSDGVGGTLVVLGLLSLGFALMVLFGDGLGPAFVSAVTAAALFITGLLALEG